METLQLSDVDRRIVAALAQFGRIPYKDLAVEVGIPTSTCHGRVRALEERGVIRGYRADISPEAIGQSVSALIMLRVHGHQRDQVPALSTQLQRIPGVQQVFLIGATKTWWCTSRVRACLPYARSLPNISGPIQRSPRLKRRLCSSTCLA
ncbi:Lrp/AsnC family transcriptional regulator [Leucobacter coleopterorum]|uniref:Lrp/AsnC family transcriptional regulator n=1 Tax=Leucobacter coleopterorum TaxID=2714933 RepID=A0ABX6K1Q4_9MICO|nr:Lrp/AsnC family transcriptional regulator [Leucobacter coleopterorum]QIM18980.1 Lrp/AsnC family transcriptional regulator [Leucobacter coleopterorum]